MLERLTPGPFRMPGTSAMQARLSKTTGNGFEPVPRRHLLHPCSICRLVLAAGWLWWATLAMPAPSVALFYGPSAPLDELKAYDVVVVDPGHGYDPVSYRRPYSELYAYVSVGEVHPTRPYFDQVPAAAKLAVNGDWGSVVVDLSQPPWPEFLADKVVSPLWDKGYRGFFLDTLDAYRLAPKFDEAAQQQGLIRVITTLHRRFPGIRLIMNRGFDVVPAVKDMVQMVAAESLFRGWNAGTRRYVEVPPQDREWLLAQLLRVRDGYGLPVLSIDYVPPEDRELARATAERIKALGIVPWVSDGALGSLGVGRAEVLPRKIIALYDGREVPAAEFTSLHRLAEMPLNHLGYTLEYRDINRPLPEFPLAGRFAAIILWVEGTPRDPARLSAWLRRQAKAGIKVAILGQVRGALDDATLREFQLAAPGQPAPGRLAVTRRDALFGFEAQPVPDRLTFQPLRLAPGAGTSLLEIADRQGQRFDGAAVTPWGGYAAHPFVVAALPGTGQARWVLDPFAFLRRTLRLPDMPVPDTTTENGRRLLFVQIDGQGFAGRSELPGTPLAGAVLVEEVLTRYRLPTTLSLANEDVTPRSAHAKEAAEIDRLARRISALPQVELVGPTRYGGARATWFPAGDASRTRITRAYPSLTAVGPLGLEQPGERRIYPALADESPYTDFWRGPFYGFQRVVETAEMTDQPRRLKPIHIYHHAYSASKPAALNALKAVYDWSLQQPVQVVHGADFLDKAADFYTAVIARDGDAWLYRGQGSLRTLRAPDALGYPDPAASSGLVGYSPGPEGRYLHLAGGESRLRFAPAATPRPYLVDANARVADWSADGGALRFTLHGYQPLRFTLANVVGCKVDADGRALTPSQPSTSTSAFHLDHATAKIRIDCSGR